MLNSNSQFDLPSVKITEALLSADGSHTEYEICVSRDGTALCTVRRRYSRFVQLHVNLSSTLRLPPFPAKKRYFNTVSVQAERKRLLQNFLRDALATIAGNRAAGAPLPPSLHEFFGDASGGALFARPVRPPLEGTVAAQTPEEAEEQVRTEQLQTAKAVVEEVVDTAVKELELARSSKEPILGEGSTGKRGGGERGSDKGGGVPGKARGEGSGVTRGEGGEGGTGEGGEYAGSGGEGAHGVARSTGGSTQEGWAGLLCCLPQQCVKEAATDGMTRQQGSAVLPLAVLLEGHIKARSQDNPSYPQRQSVSESCIPWDMSWSSYSPEMWTHDVVLANNRELPTGNKWADPPEMARAGLEQRISYAGDGKPKPLILDADGTPQNPAGRTGLRGRGLLGKWGPNQAADPIVTRHHPVTRKLQMVAIRRKDTDQWAIPGGMVDDGEAVSATLRREFSEKAGNIEDAEARIMFENQVRTAVIESSATTHSRYFLCSLLLLSA